MIEMTHYFYLYNKEENRLEKYYCDVVKYSDDQNESLRFFQSNDFPQPFGSWLTFLMKTFSSLHKINFVRS